MGKGLTYLCVLLLTIWLPASTYSRIECAGLIPIGDCCHQDQDDSASITPDSCSVCCLIDSGNYVSSEGSAKVVGGQITSLVIAPDFTSLTQPTVSADKLILTASPPWILPALSFNLRMALPSLAPPQIA